MIRPPIRKPAGIKAHDGPLEDGINPIARHDPIDKALT
jgi:hypothetical protein